MEMEVRLAETIQGVGAAGDRVTLALTEQEVHDPTELADYLAGYRPFGYRADEASPVVGVDNSTFKYRNFSSDDAFEPVKVKGSEGGAVPEVDPRSTLLEASTEERYIGAFIPRQTQNSATAYNPQMAAGRRCMRAVNLDREIDVFGLIGLAASWAAGQQTAATGTGWTDLVSGNPILDVQTMVEKSAQMVNAIWMNQRVANRFLRHPEVRDHMRQFFGDQQVQGIATAVARSGQDGANADFLIPGLPPFKVVASKVKLSGTIDYVMPDVAVGVTTPPGVPSDGEDIATTWSFRRKGQSGVGVNVREFFIENRGPEGGTMIVVNVADKPIMTASNAGGIITGV